MKFGRRPSCSKSRKVRESEFAAMHMHAAKFGAAMQGRKHLAGVEKPLRVEGTFEALLLIEVDLGKHLRHQIALFDAHTVLAGQHAAELDAGPEDVGAEGFRPLDLAGLVGVV